MSKSPSYTVPKSLTQLLKATWKRATSMPTPYLPSAAKNRANAGKTCMTTIRFSISPLSYVLNPVNRACIDQGKLIIIHRVI
jgi:hypothetical protein